MGIAWNNSKIEIKLCQANQNRMPEWMHHACTTCAGTIVVCVSLDQARGSRATFMMMCMHATACTRRAIHSLHIHTEACTYQNTGRWHLVRKTTSKNTHMCAPLSGCESWVAPLGGIESCWKRGMGACMRAYIVRAWCIHSGIQFRFAWHSLISILEWIHSNIEWSMIMLEWIHTKMEWIHSNIISETIIIVNNFFVIKDRKIILSGINSHNCSRILWRGLHIKFQKTLVRIHSILVWIHSILVWIRTKWNELLPK